MENWPGAQMVAGGVSVVDPAGHAYPALQLPLHAALASAVSLPYRPAGQSLQAETPPTEYWPGEHGAEVAVVDPGTQAYPGAQGPLH